MDVNLLEDMARRVRAQVRADAATATTRRAAVRHDQAGHGPGLFLDERLEQGGSRDELDGLEL